MSKMPTINRIPISIPEDLEPKYVNVCFIAHTPREFVLDFATTLPGPPPKINTRLILSPIGAKLLINALQENLKRYEEDYGEINIPRGVSLADKLFNMNPPKETTEEQ